ncbi:MmpS family transport accessory protein [Mycobacterium sp. NPDC048908]|uniref:MmpS family transport accessory protein n=1 Tax=Mycobacterium sp. NPDC048908 TaxID=3364292 RepID=UPI0037229CDA
MSGPPGSDEGAEFASGQEPGDKSTPDQSAAPETGETEIYSQAYSAPESEHFTSGPYVPADSSLYDYDSYEPSADLADQGRPPRWPWVVGVAAIVAAIALVASVSVLVTRTDTDNLATPATTTTPPPVQDEITTTTPPPPPPPPPETTTEAPPPPPPPETVTVTQEPAPPPPPPAAEAPPPPPPTSAAPPPPATTTPAGPRQVTYSVTGTKAPGDIITVTYIDASGRSRTQRNVYIPWSLTVTPISQSEVGSVQASSLFLVSRLNCSITTSDGTVLSSNTNNAAQTSC